MVSFDAGGESYEVIPDEDSAATNRTRLIAARAKIAAAQAAIEDDIDDIDAHLVILNGTPTNAQVLAAVKDMLLIEKKNCNRISGVGDYIIAISKFIEKKIRDGND
jgi:hypothetical protein